MSIPLIYILVVLVCFHVEFPFEFRALDAICSFLDAHTRELETDTYPALDKLTSKFFFFFWIIAPRYFLSGFSGLDFSLSHPVEWMRFVAA